jgi:hypothetical protein
MSISGILSSSVGPKPIGGVRSPQTLCDDAHVQLAVKLGSLTVRMKDIDEVLVQKELELARVGKELEALGIVAPLLRGEEGGVSEVIEPTRTLTLTILPQPAVVGSNPAFALWWERWREMLTRLLSYAGAVRLKVVRAGTPAR